MKKITALFIAIVFYIGGINLSFAENTQAALFSQLVPSDDLIFRNGIVILANPQDVQAKETAELSTAAEDNSLFIYNDPSASPFDSFEITYSFEKGQLNHINYGGYAHSERELAAIAEGFEAINETLTKRYGKPGGFDKWANPMWSGDNSRRADDLRLGGAYYYFTWEPNEYLEIDQSLSSSREISGSNSYYGMLYQLDVRYSGPIVTDEEKALYVESTYGDPFPVDGGPFCYGVVFGMDFDYVQFLEKSIPATNMSRISDALGKLYYVRPTFLGVNNVLVEYEFTWGMLNSVTYYFPYDNLETAVNHYETLQSVIARTYGETNDPIEYWKDSTQPVEPSLYPSAISEKSLALDYAIRSGNVNIFHFLGAESFSDGEHVRHSFTARASTSSLKKISLQDSTDLLP
jgi:hypothetical protein